jgi:DNA (cytosine-5)-methyltransferase 1
MDIIKDYLKQLTKKELIDECKKYKISGYSNKIKDNIINLLLSNNNYISNIINKSTDNVNDDEKKDNNILEDDEKKNSIIDIDNNNLTFIDLFCGIGGFHQALTRIGATCVFASDIDAHCRNIYELNYGIKPHSDITKVNIETIPSFDILCGGFPCQSFSKAGKQLGFNDERGNLFFNICKIAEYHKPKYMIMENVRNLSTHDNGNTWNVIRNSIEQLGYYTYDNPIILNVLHFNIPQNRERVIILCKRKDLGNLPNLPTSIPSRPKDNLTNMINSIMKEDEKLENIEKYKITGKMKVVETIWNNFIQIIKNNNLSIPKFPIWTDWWDNNIDIDDHFYIKYKNWIDNNRSFYNKNINILSNWLTQSRQNQLWTGTVRKFEWQAGDLNTDDSMNTVLWSARGSGIRVKRLNYIPTLVAMSMNPIYGPDSRKLSSRELLRLQSFNDTFQFDEKYIFKQVGNAVNVTMIERSARFLIKNEPLII